MIAPNANVAARFFLQPVLSAATCVVDATVGNGHDTLFLAENTGADCQIWAFDVQTAAIRSAQTRLAQGLATGRIHWVQADHARMKEHIEEPVDAAMFNLGYLPGHDREVVTRPASLEPALTHLLHWLKPNGRITLVAYPGHGPGRDEIAFLETFLAKLPQQVLTANRLEFINQKNQPAILYTIGRTGRNRDEDSSAG